MGKGAWQGRQGRAMRRRDTVGKGGVTKGRGEGKSKEGNGERGWDGWCALLI